MKAKHCFKRKTKFEFIFSRTAGKEARLVCCIVRHSQHTAIKQVWSSNRKMPFKRVQNFVKLSCCTLERRFPPKRKTLALLSDTKENGRWIFIAQASNPGRFWTFRFVSTWQFRAYLCRKFAYRHEDSSPSPVTRHCTGEMCCRIMLNACPVVLTPVVKDAKRIAYSR